MGVDLVQRQLDERVRATSAADRMRLHAHLRDQAVQIVWAAADRAGPMTELGVARFLLRRLYPELEGPRLEAVMATLSAEWAAGTWTGFRRPEPEDDPASPG